MTELLTVKEAAANLRVCPQTIYNLCSRGALGCVRVGRAIRIPADQLGCITVPPTPSLPSIIRDHLA